MSIQQPTVKHPAKYTDKFIPIFAEKLVGVDTVIDIFAGTCKLSKIKDYGYNGRIFCNEIEPEWASVGLGKVDCITVMDAEKLPFPDNFFGAICTSPTYGNRMSDNFTAKDSSKRNTYRHTLGRELHQENTGTMNWGDKYREKHFRIWAEAKRILNQNGILILNISDHIRKGEIIFVSDWHEECLLSLGFIKTDELRIETPRLRFGQNGNVRVNYEFIKTFRKGSEHEK